MSDRPDYGARARAWWLELQQDAAARARLRRCRSPLDTLLVPQTFSLMQRLGWRGDRGERVAALAAVLAHVREDDGRRIARAMGRATLKDADSAVLSEARFRRLMTVRGADELQTAMTRLVARLDGRINVADLAKSILWWTDRTRADSAYGYYAATDDNSASTEADQGAAKWLIFSSFTSSRPMVPLASIATTPVDPRLQSSGASNDYVFPRRASSGRGVHRTYSHML